MATQNAIYHNTYWNGRGKYPDLLFKLRALIPCAGSVENPDVNPALEHFRIASNCYYDLYNNGLCNRDHQFQEVFGFDGRGELTKQIVRATDRAMNKIILAAAKEQGIATR